MELVVGSLLVARWAIYISYHIIRYVSMPWAFPMTDTTCGHPWLPLVVLSDRVTATERKSRTQRSWLLGHSGIRVVRQPCRPVLSLTREFQQTDRWTKQANGQELELRRLPLTSPIDSGGLSQPSSGSERRLLGTEAVVTTDRRPAVWREV